MAPLEARGSDSVWNAGTLISKKTGTPANCLLYMIMNTTASITRTELLGRFDHELTEIGRQFLTSLLDNDLTNGEVRDRLAEHLRLGLTFVQDSFVEGARRSGFAVRGGAEKVRVESPSVFKFVETISSLALGYLGWTGGAMLGSTVIKTVSTGMLWWKGTTVVTVASWLAGIGISPILLPVTAALLPATLGWKLAKGLMRRSQLNKLRMEFDQKFEVLRTELTRWAEGVLGPEHGE